MSSLPEPETITGRGAKLWTTSEYISNIQPTYLLIFLVARIPALGQPLFPSYLGPTTSSLSSMTSGASQMITPQQSTIETVRSRTMLTSLSPRPLPRKRQLIPLPSQVPTTPNLISSASGAIAPQPRVELLELVLYPAQMVMLKKQNGPPSSHRSSSKPLLRKRIILLLLTHPHLPRVSLLLISHLLPFYPGIWIS